MAEHSKVPVAPIHNLEEQQQAQNMSQPSARSVVVAAGIAFNGVNGNEPPLELPDGRIVPGNFILGSS